MTFKDHRPAEAKADAEAVGRMIHGAVRASLNSRGFATGYPVVETAPGLARFRVVDPLTLGVVADRAGEEVIDCSREALGVRTGKDAFIVKTMAPCAAVGFDPREQLALVAGTPRDLPPGCGR